MRRPVALELGVTLGILGPSLRLRLAQAAVVRRLLRQQLDAVQGSPQPSPGLRPACLVRRLRNHAMQRSDASRPHMDGRMASCG